MKFLVVGGGSAGKRHLKNLLFLGQQVVVCEPLEDRAREIAGQFKVPVVHQLKDAFKERYDAALIANPNTQHLPSALEAAQQGCHLFIEKPLSHSLDGVDELIALTEQRKLKTLLGCNWKFHKSFQRMKRMIDEGEIGKILSFSITAGWYLPDWHPWEDYRKNYSANKSMGGGILLDSHEFDYLQWFLGPIKELACFSGTYSSLDIDTEDIATAILKLEGGVVGSLHIDYIQHPNRRTYHFYSERGAIEWSFQEKRIKVISPKEEKWRTIDEDPAYEFNEMYVEEMRHFIDVLQGKAESITDIYKAKQILQVIEAARRSAGNKETVAADAAAKAENV